MNELALRRLLLPVGFALLGVHCVTGIPRMANDEAGRCQAGLDMFERARCTNVTPTPADAAVVQVELAQYKGKCTDRESQSRMAALDACAARYQSAYATAKSDHDDIRAKYAKETAAVKADPAYQPLLEKWALARDEANIAEQDLAVKGHNRTSSPYYRVCESKKAALDKLSADMRELLVKHGIDTRYSTVLGLF